MEVSRYVPVRVNSNDQRSAHVVAFVDGCVKYRRHGNYKQVKAPGEGGSNFDLPWYWDINVKDDD